jgi:hypothetical protein
VVLTRTIWASLIGGIAVFLTLALGIAYARQAEEQDQLNKQWALAQQRLGRYSTGTSLEPWSSRYEEIQAQLLESKSRLESARFGLRRPTDSMDVSDMLLKAAGQESVEVVMFSSGGYRMEIREGVVFSILPVVLKIEGDMSNVVNFCRTFAAVFPTGSVESVEIRETTQRGTRKSSADIRLNIYSYAGEAEKQLGNKTAEKLKAQKQ